MKHRLFKIFYFFILLFLLQTSDTYGQPYYFRHYQVENGLSNNSVFFIRQDSKGFIWIATKDGLNRFDGFHFKVFRIDEVGNEKHLTTDYIFCVLPRKDGWLWVGSQRGLYQFNPEKEKLEPFLDSLPNVFDITIDRKGDMWFISSATVCRYNFETKTLTQFPPSRYFSATALCLTQDGNIWVGTENGFLERFNPGNNSFTGFDLFSHSKTPSSKWIQKIRGSENNTIFVGTTAQGLKIFNVVNSVYEDVLAYNTDKTSIFVRDFLQNSKNEYWIATESGIFIYNTEAKTFTNVKKKFQDPYSLNDNAIYGLFKDKEGGIWAGTFFGGINYYAERNAVFKKYFPDNGANSISGNAVREICEDRYGALWVGTEDGALNKINSVTGSIEHFKPSGEKESIAYTNIHGLLADGDDLWIGTFEHGIDVMDIKTGKVKRHYIMGSGQNDLKSNFALCFIHDSQGKIIIGTSNGLYSYDREKDNFPRYQEVPLGSFVTSIIEDHNKIIWAGTNNDGAFWFDPATGRHGHLQNEINNKNTLSNSSINDIYEDSNGNIWFATEGGGITKLDSTRRKFTFLTTSNGLPGDFVYKILEDDEKTLWATTSKGLVSFGDHFQNPVVYTRANGLLSNQFNYHSGFKDANGRLYFGCVKGMVSFLPLDFLKNRLGPPVYITGIQVFNAEVNPEKDSKILNRSIINADKIKLAYYQSSISFDFAALSYISPEMTEYRYQLEGLENGWTHLKTNRKVYFTNLSPGHYVLKIMASVNGVWDTENVKQLAITIAPPIWATWWAYLFYTILSLLILYYIINNVHRRQMEKKEKEIYETKIEFFTNVAHEIRTPLTLIKGPVENLLEKRFEMPALEEDLDCLDKNTNRLMQLVSQILDFRQTEIKKFSLDFTRVNINETLEETYRRFKILAQKRKLDYQLSLPSMDIIALADVEALQKIFSNLIGNAVKYAEKKVVIKLFSFEKQNNSFTIIFENDGYIIKKEMAENIFKPFYRIKETKYQKGTGIGLALARSLTLLHKGSLEISFLQSNFNTFVLTLPIEPEQAVLKIRKEKEPQI